MANKKNASKAPRKSKRIEEQRSDTPVAVDISSSPLTATSDFPEVIPVISISDKSPSPTTPSHRSYSPELRAKSDSDLELPSPSHNRKKPAARKRKAASSDAGSEDSVPKKKKAKQKQKQKETLDPRRKLVLYIPQALSEGTQRENLRHSTPFASVLERIYETLGCVDLEIKPKLSYKLSNATAKSDTINLTSAADWEGCLEEVTEVERKKKGLLVSVRIQCLSRHHGSGFGVICQKV
ncbi:hypothetical protein C8R46DRAFT_1262897 [Mycena filopes]|nr:hypothetical protein C8R46DRAFT_1262897 [Mycena filopes]